MDEFDERLAAEVRKHRRLYDNACPSRKNSKATMATWRAVGSAVREEPTACMRRWKALRDKFVRLKKRIRTRVVPPGYEGDKVVVHVIHEKLCWLNEHVTHRAVPNKADGKRMPKREDQQHHLNDSGVTTDVDQSSEAMLPSEAECDDSDECRPPKTQADKRKADGRAEDQQHQNQHQQHQGDQYDRYTQTVADFMRGLSRRRCVLFKKRLNDLMYEMDLEELDDFAQS
ncbi:unnamed protein product [Merluccius merluccius]